MDTSRFAGLKQIPVLILSPNHLHKVLTAFSPAGQAGPATDPLIQLGVHSPENWIGGRGTEMVEPLGLEPDSSQSTRAWPAQLSSAQKLIITFGSARLNSKKISVPGSARLEPGWHISGP